MAKSQTSASEDEVSTSAPSIKIDSSPQPKLLRTAASESITLKYLKQLREASTAMSGSESMVQLMTIAKFSAALSDAYDLMYLGTAHGKLKGIELIEDILTLSSERILKVYSGIVDARAFYDTLNVEITSLIGDPNDW